MTIDEKRAAEIAACRGQHVPTHGEKGVECVNCGLHLFDYEDGRAEARAALAEARRRANEGFKRDRPALTAKEMQHRAVEIIDQAQATLIEVADRNRTDAMSLPDVLQLLIRLRTEIRRIE